MQTVTSIRVRYSETDAMGIVYHANYLVWFEVARNELFRNLGLPYTKFEAEGLGLAVIEADIRYKAPAKYDDLLELRAGVVKVSSRKIVFQYEICRCGQLICQGSTTHVFINKDGRSTSAAGYPIWREVKEVLYP